MKTRSFLYATSWLEHFRRIPPRRKNNYLRKFSKRFPRISQYLEHVKISTNTDKLVGFIKTIHPAIIIVDDKLASLTQSTGTPIVLERNIRYRHHERLMLIADNLANYFRVLLRNNPRKFREELNRIEK
ncbi:hypothetical protein DRO31_06415 [Candidatus Bathyarchaeota archaeon]|nr:MAG: hypothetical protein DRO31_06415 [Candidatus Bathyarchaeota archaeon]